MRNACEERIESLLSQLTLDEKIGMIHGAGIFRTAGVPRLGIPSLVMSDGPMGVRAEFGDGEWVGAGHGADKVSYLPCNSAIASTWDRDLARSAGRVLGCEARGRGKDVILAPGINIKRSPLCGRNFEYMCEDPYLTGELAAQVVQGIQENDVAACPKHFACNSQETERLWVDTVVDERTLNEIYFPGFRAAVDAGAYTIMGAYNRLHGEHCCTSRALLDGVLRDQWGFDGAVISDWGGVHDTDAAAHSSLDVEMSVAANFDEYYMANPLKEKIGAGEIDETVIDAKVRNILRLMIRLNMLEPESRQRKRGAFDDPAHAAAARKVAAASIVLLKNEGNLLPLDEDRVKTVAVIGANAETEHSYGGGSAEIQALYEHTPLRGITMLLAGRAKVRYAPGYIALKRPERKRNWQAESIDRPREVIHSPKASETDRRAAIDEALAIAKDADAVIYVGGLDHRHDLEGQDRQSMRLPYGQGELIEALLAERPDTIMVMMGGSPVEMPWLGKAKALVWSYYAGMEGGTALADVLFGRVCPGGKLAETFPVTADDCYAHKLGEFGRKDTVTYRDGLLVGYRYYDTANVPVNFPFGYGLSYTRFDYENIAIGRADGGWTVRFDVVNAGERAGAEVAQMYIAPENRQDGEPVHALKGFARVTLEPGERKTVELALTRDHLAVWDSETHGWAVRPGGYGVQIGASSRDIRLTGRVEI